MTNLPSSRLLLLTSLAIAGCAAESTQPDEETTDSAFIRGRAALAPAAERGAGSVHFGNAHFLARLSELAYGEPQAFEAGMPALGVDARQVVPVTNRCTGAFAYFVKNERFVAVVFRGSEDKLDWRANLDTALLEWSAGTRAHRGFTAQLSSIWTKQPACGVAVGLRELLDGKPGLDGRALYLTGHSLGGALATLATSRLLDEGTVPVTALYAFGAPRVGDAAFGSTLVARARGKTALFRFAYGRDSVTAIPEATATEPYRHFAAPDEDETKYEISLTLTRVNVGGGGPAFADRWSIVDHAIEHYVLATKLHSFFRR